MLYRQMPARSPIPAAALTRLPLQAFALGLDPRAALRTLLLERYHAAGCHLFASGTHALQVALQAVKSKAGAPVLLPAYTCYEVATAAVGANVPVALYDVDASTLEPVWESVFAAAPHGAAALVVAPLYGMTLDWDAVRAAATKLGATLIADVAQANGSTWQGRPAGWNADFAVLSFGRGKGWTGAGGGALLWRADTAQNDEVAPTGGAYRPMAEAKSVARASSQWLLGRKSVYGLPAAIPFLKLGETIYHEPTPPTEMTRTCAALLLAGDGTAQQEVLQRRRNAAAYTELFGATSGSAGAVIGASMGNDSGALRYPIRTAGGWSRLRTTEAVRLGAGPGYPTSLHEIPALQPQLRNTAQEWPMAELLVRELITLPTHSQIGADERQQLVDVICG